MRSRAAFAVITVMLMAVGFAIFSAAFPLLNQPDDASMIIGALVVLVVFVTIPSLIRWVYLQLNPTKR